MPKVDLKSIGREIKKVQKQVKTTRARAVPEDQDRLAQLISSLDSLYDQTVKSCPESMRGTPYSLKKAAPRRAKSRRKTR